MSYATNVQKDITIITLYYHNLSACMYNIAH